MEKIKVWEVSPHIQYTEYDVLVEKDLTRLSDIFKYSIPNFLERYTEEQLKEGVTITIKLAEMPLDEWDEIED